MLEFKEVFKETGVDLANSYMSVGLGSSNLVALHDSKALEYDRTKLEVVEVNGKTLSRVNNALMLQFQLWGVSNEDANTYLAVMQHQLSRYRILSVTGKASVKTAITVANGPSRKVLDVSIFPHLNYDVAFRFVHLQDESGNDLGSTEKKPSDADSFIDKLNWVYGLQANVSLNLTDAKTVAVQLPAGILKAGDPLPGEVFLKYVVGQKSEKADFTVFFVQRYLSVDKIGGAETFWDEDACVVGDHPEKEIVVPKGYDAFVVNLAHEVAHYLIDFKRGYAIPGADHHYRQNILLSQLSQTTKLDKGMVELLNGISKTK